MEVASTCAFCLKIGQVSEKLLDLIFMLFRPFFEVCAKNSFIHK